ncbi:tyrosine-type recombinase/integrase [Neisseria elongata]|jgi:site-specific recombinase, phage integrase family|uniref:tyrosine-type recombinase/integrase n=1 Tax=Neisseria elongata TaxID=495 RepID=UPI0006668128|nr:integrase arm-type DNA-binding domain-containing protein [Neisseria elongata]
MPLNDRQIRNAKPTEAGKKAKLFDGGGLYLEVTPAGGKIFRLKYRIDGKEKTLTIGKYPSVSLSEARQAAALNTFESIARRWHSDNLRRWKENHAARVIRYLEAEVFPAIGAMQIQEIKAAHIKALLDGIMTRGVHNTAEKIREWTAAVFDYAAMLEITESNPARILRQYIPPKPATNRPALPREELTEFYRRLMLADVEHSNRIGLLLIMLVFVRNTELRGGKWEEIDFQSATWTIPAERMKHEKTAPKSPHVIPLADWPLELLAELREITGRTPYLFPSRTKAEGFISENTLGKIMNSMGYKGRATPHGFRALASSILNEQGYNPDAIERQLAHVEEDRIRAAYNRADYMDERREMMQWYSDYLRERYRRPCPHYKKSTAFERLFFV